MLPQDHSDLIFLRRLVTDLQKIPIQLYSYPSDQSLSSAAGFFYTLRGLLSNQITHHSDLNPTENTRLCVGFVQALDQTTTLAAKPI